MLGYAITFIISIFVSTLLTWLVRNVAGRYGLLQAPISSRHVHIRPIPRLGGVAIFATFILVYGMYSAASAHGLTRPAGNGDLLKIVLLSTCMFLVGVADDFLGMTAWSKLIVQISAGLGLFYSGIRFNFCYTHIAGSWTNVVCLIATVLWVVLICNAINLIDGLDGLAAGAALFSMVTIFTLALGNRPGVATATTILAGSLFGFLVFNFNPASIFLGDSGSLFVGFILSAFVLAESNQRATTIQGILIPLVSFALPLTDLVISFLRRFLSGHSIFGADREHIHHKLLALGMTQRQVVWILYGISALCAMLSLSLMNGPGTLLVPIGSILLMILFFGLRKLEYHEFIEVVRLPKLIARRRKAFARTIALRKAVAQLSSISDCEAIATLLENCLNQDFDGFDIALDEAFAEGRLLGPCWDDNFCLSRHWNVSRERLILTIDLCAPDTIIGRLSLYHDIEKKVLIDLGLLTETFRHGLAEALLDKFPPRSSSTETGATARNGNAAVAEYYPEEISGD